MDTSLLRCFLTVSNTQSFSAAAARLNVTQSTVSHQIARLEEHLGKQLFERTTRNCRLSADGRDLLPHAVRVLRSVEEMEESFRPRLLSGTVAIGVPDDYYLFNPITTALGGFMRDKPGVAVEMRAGLAVDHLRDLKAGILDLAVVRELDEGPGEALRTEPMVWIAAQGWVPPADGVIPLAAVEGGCAYRKAAIAALDKRGIRWKCQFSCTSLEGVLSVVRAGFAVSVVIHGDARQDVRGIVGDIVLPRLPVTRLVIRHADREPSLAARALARTMANMLSTDTVPGGN